MSLPGKVDRETLARLLSDVRLLGGHAPLRAGYEVSKRAGGHALVFGRLARSSRESHEGVSPIRPRRVPTDVRQRTLAAADDVVDGLIELFGRQCRLGDPPDWNAVIHAHGSWPVTDWWRVDLRSDNRAGDVKWVWELGRHRHLVLLARAAYLDPSSEGYLECLERHLDSWVAACPPEKGVHWSSNLEIALRAISWLQILALVDHRIKPDLRMEMWRHLHHAARHLVADLPYTKSTMRNNHLLGDALGLIALGKAFGGKGGDRWLSIGNRIFDRQLRRHMRSDGSMIEDSLSYHRFVLEMLSMRVVLGDADDRVRRAMSDAARYLARLGVLDGDVPQFGDWDEGRVFVVAKDPSSLGGSVRLALSLGGSGAPASWRASDDEVAWFVDEGTPQDPDRPEVDGTDLGGGIARAEVGLFTVWLKAGSGPSHGHADLTSTAIAHAGLWLTGDPGTGTYNGSAEVRDYFRSSVSHNVSRVEGEDQLGPHRVFRWRHDADGRVGGPVSVDGATIMWAVHTAYTRCSPSRRIARVVIVSTGGVEVIDFVEGPPIAVDVSLPLPPNVTWKWPDSKIQIGDEVFDVNVPSDEMIVVIGGDAPFRGWWSETYGTAVPSTLIVFRCTSKESIRWGIRHHDGAGQDQALSAEGAFEISVAFEDGSTRLDVVAGHDSITRIV